MTYSTKKLSQRTLLQNRALHKLFQLWADALNDAGKHVFIVLKDYFFIPWTEKSVEAYLWKPVRLDGELLTNTDERFRKELEKAIEVHLIPTVEELINFRASKWKKEYFSLVASALNNAGHDMRAILLPRKVELWWDKDTVKEFLWRPVQKHQLQKISTTQLSTKEIDEVYDTVNRHLGKHIETVMFPSIDEIIIQQNYAKGRN